MNYPSSTAWTYWGPDEWDSWAGTMLRKGGEINVSDTGNADSERDD